jgi:hypothetical protein
VQIFIDGEGAEPLFQAILAAPFSERFKQSFINEILTAPGPRGGLLCCLGLFNSAGIEALPTSDHVTRTKLSRSGELMIAALRALASPTEVESGHSIPSFQSAEDHQ